MINLEFSCGPSVACPSFPWLGSTPFLLRHRTFASLVSLGLLGSTLSLVVPEPAGAAGPPSRVGSCSDSFAFSKRFRMVPSPGDSDYQRSSDPFGKEVIISLTNGLSIYSGDGDEFILSTNFAPGHRVQACLLALPKDCPPGDQRGKRYRFVDLQTGARAEGIDSWHFCGGA